MGLTLPYIKYKKCRLPEGAPLRRIGDFKKLSLPAVPWKGPETGVLRLV